MIIFNALQTTLSGGIGRYSYELSKAIYLSKQIEIKLVIREQDKELFEFAKQEDLIIINNINTGIQRNIYEQFKLPKLIAKKYPKAIVHYPDSMAPLFSKNKVIITVHDIAFKTLKNVFNKKTAIWKGFVTKLSLKKAYKIIAISEYTKKEIIKYYGEIYKEKISVVYNGFNDFSRETIETTDIRSEILDMKDMSYILTVSTISPRKNIDRLIKAYNEMKNKDTSKLVIAGNFGWLYEDILKLSKELNLEDSIIFTGKINDNELKYLYKHCDIFTYLSLYEGFGLPPLEAMSYMKKCIVSNTTSLPEVVGHAAITVNPLSINEIADEMDKAIKNKQVHEETIKENINRFSWEECSKQTINNYVS